MSVIIWSMQASLNNYWLDHLNLLREQVRAEWGRIACSREDATEKANSCVNYVYPNNEHMCLKPRDALLEIQFKPVDGSSVSHL